MAKRFFALNAPPTECLCCNHVCRQRSNSGEQACSGMPYPRISPHFPPVFPRFSLVFPVFPRFSPFFPVFPHFPHFSHFSVAQKRLGDSGVGDFQGLCVWPNCTDFRPFWPVKLEGEKKVCWPSKASQFGWVTIVFHGLSVLGELGLFWARKCTESGPVWAIFGLLLGHIGREGETSLLTQAEQAGTVG